jgi:hypothetical protein
MGPASMMRFRPCIKNLFKVGRFKAFEFKVGKFKVQSFKNIVSFVVNIEPAAKPVIGGIWNLRLINAVVFSTLNLEL